MVTLGHCQPVTLGYILEETFSASYVTALTLGLGHAVCAFGLVVSTK